MSVSFSDSAKDLLASVVNPAQRLVARSDGRYLYELFEFEGGPVLGSVFLFPSEVHVLNIALRQSGTSFFCIVKRAFDDELSGSVCL